MAIEINDEFIRHLEMLIEKKDDHAIIELLAEEHTADIAEIIDHNRQTLSNQGQGNGVAFGGSHIHHAGGIETVAFQRPLLDFNDRYGF